MKSRLQQLTTSLEEDKRKRSELCQAGEEMKRRCEELEEKERELREKEREGSERKKQLESLCLQMEEKAKQQNERVAQRRMEAQALEAEETALSNLKRAAEEAEQIHTSVVEKQKTCATLQSKIEEAESLQRDIKQLEERVMEERQRRVKRMTDAIEAKKRELREREARLEKGI